MDIRFYPTRIPSSEMRPITLRLQGQAKEEKNTIIDTIVANDTISSSASLRARNGGPYNRQFVRKRPRASMGL